MPPLPPIVLTFAASDPTGGAGLQADLLTLASMGCHPLSVVTALTVQDTHGVEGLIAVEADLVAAQARLLLEDVPVDAFKVGVLGSRDNIAAVAKVVSDYPDVPLVLDPVLASGRGDPLASEEMLDALREWLLPVSTIVTPNSLELRRLAGKGGGAERDAPDLDACARRLLALGCKYLLVTGTHEPGNEVVNTLYGRQGVLRSDRWQRLPDSYHGSGCTLASAIAAALANRLAVSEAVREAQEYTWQALARGFRPGTGQFLPDRFFWARDVKHESNVGAP
ncbi:MAG TPA: hydroxymethylpyrimidine/phosphomethylpyrimidine kinase [Burkholderiales bacterium]|nr:hydroxymethylpyrimidine/phosphomethylpyrimidine kinase [Burkholderiales bacterium]